MLAVLVTLASFFALKATASFTLPLAFAIFLLALVWPLQRWLKRFVPSGIAMAVCLVVVVACAAGLGQSIAESLDEVKDHAGRYTAQLEQTLGSLRDVLKPLGIRVPTRIENLPVPGGTGRIVTFVSERAVALVGGIVLTLAFLGLGLLEVPGFAEKLKLGERHHDRTHWPSVLRRIGTSFQRYIVVRTAVGLITGVGTGLGAWIIGLDFWYIWGLLNFLLNYIPTLGSIIGVIPPVVFALLQFGSWGMAALTLAVIGGVQLVMGNWIDPLMQGRYLSLSSLVVLLSVALWGWVWGIPGAFIGVPLTVAVVLTCREFESTRWIAMALADRPEEALRSTSEPSDAR